MNTYTCHHHNTHHATHADTALHICGCDGTRHNACEQILAPANTPRPERWPAYLTWQTALPPRTNTLQTTTYTYIVVNHTTRTAHVRGTYARKADATRGATRGAARQGDDITDTLVFPSHLHDEYLKMIAPYADVTLFHDNH